MNGRDSLLAALVATVWGFNFVVIDWGMHDVPPLLFAAIRFTLVVLPAVFFVPRPSAPWRTVAAVGVFMSLGQFGLLYVAMDAGPAAGSGGPRPAGAGDLHDRPGRRGAARAADAGRRSSGCSLASVGLVVVALGRGGHVTVAALTLCLLGALSWGIGNVVSRASGVSGGLSLTVWSATVVPIPLFLLSLALDGPTAVADALTGFTWQAVVSTLYTAGLASLVGYGIFNTLLSRNPSSSVVPWVLLAPVVAMASAWLLLDEVPTPAELLGGAVLVVGVLIALRPVARTPCSRSATRPDPGSRRSTNTSVKSTSPWCSVITAVAAEPRTSSRSITAGARCLVGGGRAREDAAELVEGPGDELTVAVPVDARGRQEGVVEVRRVAGRVREGVGVQRSQHAASATTSGETSSRASPSQPRSGAATPTTLMSSAASRAPAAISVANAARASDTVSVADASRARSLANAPAANVASGRAAAASSTSRRPSTNRPRTDRPTTSRTASRGRPSASPRARARRNEASESPSTPLATSLSPAASAGPAKTSVSPSSAQDLVDLDGRLAAGEDRQPAGGDRRGRPHDRRVQVRRPGRRHQGVQRLRLVRSDRGGVDDGRAGPTARAGPRRARRGRPGRRTGRAAPPRRRSTATRGRAAAAAGPGTDVVDVGEAGGHGRAHPAEAEDGNRGHAHQRGSTPNMRQAQIRHGHHALPS